MPEINKNMIRFLKKIDSDSIDKFNAELRDNNNIILMTDITDLYTVKDELIELDTIFCVYINEDSSMIKFQKQYTGEIIEFDLDDIKSIVLEKVDK